ncbi:MAG: XdhC family protein [Alphaproteobacteria bacterium]|jgi:xanthine dehydrogenase accessory factor|nr:MAG: XdhC family protein [Alphaproteobacteria bacterium]
MSDRLLPPGLTGDLDVLAFAEAELAAGRPAALITIIGLDGPFSRPLGAQLAVSGSHQFAGSISGGCLERALTEEAQVAMKEGTNRVLRYGTGSPYLDVRLPCGGGINLHVDVNIGRVELQRAIALGRARRSFAITFDPAAPRASFQIVDETIEAPSGHFTRRFEPKLRIVLAGRGWEIVAMSQLAQTADVELVVASQEPATLEFCRPYADQLIQLTVPRAVPDLPLDADTAVACLFHEHEWEGELLLKALRSPAFYVGALGSRQTQRTRAEALTALGATPEEMARLKGPIGLFPSQDPRSLAVSALAEIVKVRTTKSGGAQ